MKLLMIHQMWTSEATEQTVLLTDRKYQKSPHISEH